MHKIEVTIKAMVPEGKYCLKCPQKAYIRRRQICTLFKKEVIGYGKGLVKCQQCLIACEKALEKEARVFSNPSKAWHPYNRPQTPKKEEDG